MIPNSLLSSLESSTRYWDIQKDRLEKLRVMAKDSKPLDGNPSSANSAPRSASVRGETATIPIRGVLLPSAEESQFWRRWGVEATGYEEIRSMLASALNDSGVRKIILQINSPGGTVEGTVETADAIWAARKNSGKSVMAFIQEMGASAAYYMASQAEKIVAGPNAVIGCIGTVVIYDDTSKFYESIGIRPVVIKAGEFKGAMADGTPITEEQVKMHQPVINGMADNFVRDVARGRGLSVEQVKALATGAIWLAPDAWSNKLIDLVNRTNTFEGVSDMELTEQEKKKIAADAAAASRQLMADLSKEFPGDPEFAQEQFAKGATVTEAKAAYADKLKSKLAESQAAQDQLKTELDKAKAQNATVAKTATQAAQGCKPIQANGAEAADGGAKDFVAQAKERARERNITTTQAMKELAAMDPAGHQKWVESQGPLPVL